ncbi:uncharacterized protein LOC132738878 [Ruditapes philippinarum]|uniref:uncharacterized protein LOC132738878 n=1 Tax=Ruditapes philippinarum TaxID=129788 RepID=UPI00295BC5D5|nr:uncharacterized protein LOC132738878 [Ruditapes philippinarum]
MSREQHTFTSEDRSLTLSVLTHDDYKREGVCLMSIATSSPYPHSTVVTDKYAGKTADTDDHHVIIPVVASSIATFVCLAVVIFIVIICRRHRSVKEKRNNQSNEVTMSDLETNIEQSE